jgi:hypothetical protein
LKKTFEHLLGLNVRDALAILKSSGIFGVRVTFTSAPAPLKARETTTEENGSGAVSMLEAITRNFDVSEDGEPPLDPLLEPELTDGMLVEARVVGVRDDGKQLIVSRFHVSPKRDA